MAGLSTPKESVSLWISISKSTVSNAAETSSNARSVTLPLSMAWWKSERRRMRSVSVEWPVLKPDWNRGRRLFLIKYFSNRPATSLSMIFKMNEIFETGRKLAGSSISNPGFFILGVTNALFCETGTLPTVIDRLHISWRNGKTTSKTSLRRWVGIGSSSHDFDGTDLINSSSSSIWHGSKECILHSVLVKSGIESVLVSSLTFLIFFSKNCWKISGEKDGTGDDVPRPSIVERLFHKSFGLSVFRTMISSQYRRSFSLKKLCISLIFCIHISLSSTAWDFLYALSKRLVWHRTFRQSVSNQGALAWQRTRMFFRGRAVSKMFLSVWS